MNRDELLEEKEIESLEEQTMTASRKVLEAGIWLIRNGFGKMMILPYAAPSGCYWRCEFHTPGQPEKPFYHYTSSNLFRYLGSYSGGSIRKSVSPEKLSKAIMVSVSEEAKKACSGSVSDETLRWLDDLERTLENEFVPQAFHEYTEDHSVWQRVSLLRGEGSPMSPQPGYVPLAEYARKAAMTRADLQDGYANYEALRKARQLTLSPKFVEEAIIGRRVGSLLLAIKSDDICDDGKGNALALRSLFGAIVTNAREIAARQGTARDFPTRKVSAAPPSDQVAKRGGRLLSAVHELHKAGYQRLRICAGWSVDGSEWRCKLLPASMTGPDGWCPHGDWSEYLSTQGKGYFGWQDCDGDDARVLANKILERFPNLAEASTGPDWAYAGWFTDIIGRSEHGELPAFYRNGFPVEQEGGESTALPPTADTYFSAERSSTGWPIIANGDLTPDMLPSPNADEEGVCPFCLSYEGYATYRTIGDCVHIADRVEHEGLEKADIDSLRVAAFIRQRAIKWSSDFMPADSKYLRSIHAIVDEIRRRLVL